MKKQNQGITLIALVVTIIVLLILAGVTVMTLTGDNGLLGKTSEAKFITEIEQYNEELRLAITEDYTNSMGNRQNKFNVRRNSYNNENSFTNAMKTKIPSFNSKYANKLEIKEDKLNYIGDNEQEREWLAEVISVAGILKINYVYENGTQAATPYQQVIPDGSYEVESPKIDGYEPDHYIVSGEINGDTNVTVTYYPPSEGFIFKGLDETGNETEVEEDIVKYKLVGVVGGKFTGETLVIPRTYNNKPVTEINRYAINSQTMKIAIIPETIKNIGDGMFSYCGTIEYLNFNASVTSMSMHAFIELNNLKKVDIGPNVERIGSNVFRGCTQLTDVTIYSNSVTDLAACTFEGCNSLQEIKISKDNLGYMVDNGILYSKDGKTLVAYPPGKTGENLKILDTVEVIDKGACAYSKYLKNVEIPSTIKIVKGSAFLNCNSLESLKVSAERIETNYAFKSTSLKNVEIDSSVKYLGPNIFNGSTGIEEFKYLGTTLDWNTISKSVHWKNSCSITKVICSDGTVDL